ncbi:MAG: hypothetical protein H7329_14330 [Opitutaceae bacterium]|nr:hypothetical protein [Cytophagales bacterium]
MIKFFKVNDPYRFGILTIVFIIIRALIFYFGSPLTQIELPFLLAARTISEGKWLYKDIWETTEPLTTLVYYLLPKGPENFSVFSYWINVILIIFNAFYANYFLQKLDIFLDKTFLPALFYILLSLTFFELNVLSAPLLASTFLLFVLNNAFSFLKKEDYNRLYDSGFFLGIASLFFLPCVAFIPSVLVTLLVFTRSQGKGYFLFLLGLLFPWTITCIVFLWIGGLNEFINIFINHYFSNFKNFIFSTETLTIFLLPITLFITGVIFSLKGNLREINFQSVSRKFLIFWLLSGMVCCLISTTKSFSLIYIIIFPLTFFYTFNFLQIKKNFIPDLIIFAFIILSLYLQYRCLSGTLWQKTVYQYRVNKLHDTLIDGKNIWVSGENQEHYLYANLSGKYLNWTVSKEDFNNTDKFYAIENIRKNFYSNLPEVIIDDSLRMPGIFDKIPQLKNRYILKDKSVYIRQRK